MEVGYPCRRKGGTRRLRGNHSQSLVSVVEASKEQLYGSLLCSDDIINGKMTSLSLPATTVVHPSCPALVIDSLQPIIIIIVKEINIILCVQGQPV